MACPLTLQGTNKSPPWERENHLQKCLGIGYVSFQEGNFFWAIIFSKDTTKTIVNSFIYCQVPTTSTNGKLGGSGPGGLRFKSGAPKSPHPFHTVDGRTPAPFVIYETQWKNGGYSQCQLVQDFFHRKGIFPSESQNPLKTQATSSITIERWELDATLVAVGKKTNGYINHWNSLNKAGY